MRRTRRETSGTPLPSPVADVSAAFLDEADAAAPGLVDGLYLCGSVALDDFHHGSSDVDFVAVLRAAPDAAGLAALAAAHRAVARRHPRTAFEGAHLTRAQLAGTPAGCPAVPSVHQGEFHPADRFAVNPVTWHELAASGIAVRGPATAELGVRTDDAAFLAFTVDNLTSYWRPWHRRLVSAPPEQTTNAEMVRCAAAWGVLGVSRLHGELAGRGLLTKCGAGGHALAAFGARWHPLIVDALGIRAGHRSRYDDPTRLHGEMSEFLGMAIDSALALA